MEGKFISLPTRIKILEFLKIQKEGHITWCPSPSSLFFQMPPKGGKTRHKMYYFLTARSHVSETQIFEDYLNILMPFIKKHQEYHYSIEKDNTCDRHIHVLLEDNAKDMDAFKRKLNTKDFKLFWEFLRGKISHKDQLTFTEIIKPDDVKKTVGYIFKDVNSRQGSSKFEDKEYIQECVSLYWTVKRLEARKPDIDDIKVVTTKNFYATTQEFCNKTNIRYDDPDILYKMKKAGYGFINLSRRQKEEGFRELRIFKNQELTQDKINVKSEMYENSDREKEEIMEQLLTLIYATDTLDFNLQQLRHRYSMYSQNIKSDDRI